MRTEVSVQLGISQPKMTFEANSYSRYYQAELTVQISSRAYYAQLCCDQLSVCGHLMTGERLQCNKTGQVHSDTDRLWGPE